MRPPSLAPAHVLAATKQHGTRIRYMGGCRCLPCRAANSRYECERQARRNLGLANGRELSSRLGYRGYIQFNTQRMTLKNVTKVQDFYRRIMAE